MTSKNALSGERFPLFSTVFSHWPALN